MSDQLEYSLTEGNDAGDKSPQAPSSPSLSPGMSPSSPGLKKSMADRRAELERKRQKLHLIKEEKKKREEERRRKELESDNAGKQEKPLSEEADALLSTLGIAPTSSIQILSPSEKSKPFPDVLGLGSREFGSVQVVAYTTSQKLKRLAAKTVSQTSIPPKEQVTYCKQTQTPSESVDREVLVYDDMPGDEDEMSDVPPETPPIHHKMPHVELVKPAQLPGEEVVALKEEKSVRDLSDEEKQQLMMSAEFQNFFDRASKIIERALAEDVDIFVDYSGRDGEDLEGDEKSGGRLSLTRQFYDERWSKGRTVTCLDWSTQYPELLVASYNNNEDSPHEPDGVVLVWNAKFKTSSPEYVFHCQSEVMSATFAKFHPNLIIGGTYSGQIVLWDNRSNKRTPIQRSPLSVAAHTHPVYCVKVVGTQNAHNLISISTDGKLCSWSLDMLSAPQDTMELYYKQSKSVAVTCLSFPAGDVNNFVVGSEEGTVYTACRHGSKAGITETYEGHQGPVTGIDYHNSQGQIDFSHLFLTSSFDWTVKLWSVKENKPLYSFEDNGDYVYDVSWSPIHPAVFASVDGMGRLDVWNLNNDTEVPTASTLVDNNVALNCLLWTQSGHQIAVGDDSGKIHMYEVGEQLAVPRNDEWSKFVHTLQDLKNNQADDEETSALSNMSASPLR